MRYRPSAAVWGPVFAVPSVVVDQHLKLCGGLSLKVLLLILRSPDQPADERTLAARLGLSPADVSDALNYWVTSGVLLTESDSVPSEALPTPLTPTLPTFSAPAAYVPPSPSVVPSPSVAPSTAPPVTGAPPPTRPRYPREEAVAIIDGDKELSSLLHEAQAIMGKPFTSADFDSLVALFSFYGLSSHYIITLLHYCILIGRRSMGYAESVAMSWLGEGVDDSTVDEQVDRLMRRRTNEGRVRTAFGIGDRRLILREREMIARWFDELGFELDVINLAYEITIERTGKLAFRYIDKILTSWHTQGIRTLEQAKGEQKPTARREDESALDRRVLDRFLND